jgi:hypothetical protein
MPTCRAATITQEWESGARWSLSVLIRPRSLNYRKKKRGSEAKENPAGQRFQGTQHCQCDAKKRFSWP